jgi:hypothetical protein
MDRGGVPGLREDPHGGAAEAESSRAGKRNPFVVSAGGGIMEVTDALLPSAKGRSGRHYERQHLSGILLKQASARC